jgi:thioredoxin-dependent peroxiredoxin
MLKFLSACAVFALGAAAAAQTPGTPAPQGPELKVGDPAPDFSLPGTDGKTHKLADYKGKTLVLAWFPKAFTGG